MHRLKRLGQHLMAWDFVCQVAELLLRIAVLNNYIVPGIPVADAVG